MRTIKFRGKTIKDNTWEYGNLLYKRRTNNKATEIYESYHIQRVNFHLELEVIPETLGQFTGFYDKNGNEIYEGDILKPLNEHFTYVVKFGNGCFYIEYILGKWNTLERGIEVYKNFDRDIEIIGNIYDNPELLEK